MRESEEESVAAEENKIPGRNEPCHCGSGRKYKQCCLGKDEAAQREARAGASLMLLRAAGLDQPPTRELPATRRSTLKVAATRPASAV